MLQNIVNFLSGLIIGLFSLVMAVIVTIEIYARRILSDIGISFQIQNALLSILLLILVVFSFRLFGRLFGVLIAVLLLALLAHAVFGTGSQTVTL